MAAEAGTDYPNESVFREIDPPQRLVFDHLSDHPFRVIATFDETGSGGTRITFRMVHESAEDCERVRALVTKANEQNFDRLEAELRRMDARS